jgi:flagellar biosynthesis/type III secretory pathway protein FliH
MTHYEIPKENMMRDYGFVPPVNKDLEELLKAARMTMKSSEPEATSDEAQYNSAKSPLMGYAGTYQGLPTEEDQQAHTEEQRYRQGFLDGFHAGQEAGLKLAQDVMDRYVGVDDRYVIGPILS